jgi:predicted heme/steroid binding protein
VLILCFSLLIIGIAPAHAGQSVILLDTDATAAKGPLLRDGTIAFSVTSSFAKAGQKKAFRADFKAGDTLTLRYLIADKKPGSAIKNSLLPQLLMISPSGKSKYLSLGRYSAPAEAGTYSFTLTSRAKASVAIAVGNRQVNGEVLRGAQQPFKPTPIPTPQSTPTKVSYTMDDVEKRNTSTECWTVVDGKIYDLTKWIPAHRGGAEAIIFLCGKDGTSSFTSQHEGSSAAISVLPNYLIGPLVP